MKIFTKNKKAQIFTLLAIALIVLTFLSIEIYSSLREKEVIKDRVKSMNSFMKAIESNLERQVYISGFRIVFLSIGNLASTGQYITNFDEIVNETFFYGTINGEFQPLMIGATKDDIVQSLNEKARKINVNITLVNTTINISQDSPWSIKVVMSSDFILEDIQGLAKWEKKQNVTAYISIEGFEDPLYVKNTRGILGSPIEKGKIKITPYEGTYNEGGFPIQNLSSHYYNGYYAANPDAPSFLNRLKGEFVSDPNGIESFVLIDTLINQKVDTDEFDPSLTKSVVDHIWFDKTLNTPGNTVSGMFYRFKIDAAHLGRYDLP